MAKTKKFKIKPVKSRIKIIDEESEDSELIEDIEKAEKVFSQESVSVSNFKAPSPVIHEESSTPERTRIQTETRQRRELDTINRVYGSRQQTESTRSTYSSSEYTPSRQTPDVFRNRQRIEAPTMNHPLPGPNLGQSRSITNSEHSHEKYQDSKRKRKSAWEGG
jgi:hypothetical protein